MKKVQIIAEAGVNHNGSLDLALKLVDAAVEAGADVVKFQTFKPDRVISKYAEKADYQKVTTDSAESQLEMSKKLELDLEAHHQLKAYCLGRNIEFLSSPFDLESINALVKLEVSTLKIPSGEITNLPYLRKIGGFKKKIIISTGMATLKEVGAALEILEGAGTPKNKVTVLHCNTEYPTPFEDVNLKAMLAIRDKFDVKVGYSDHTLGIEVPAAAVALGAEIIEKHLTLGKNMEGPDHKASLDPQEFRLMVQSIRNIEKSMGDGRKVPSSSEKKNIPIARKSIVADKDIKKGELLTENNLTVKRPGTGISPMDWDKIIGTKAIKDYSNDELISM